MASKLLSHFQSKQLSIEERIAAGKALRIKFPRAMHGEYKPAANRADPVHKEQKVRLENFLSHFLIC